MHLSLTTAVLLGLGHSGTLAHILPPQNRRPNIVFMIMDDMGVSDNSVSVFKDPNRDQMFNTPNMERLASEGAAFTQSYTPSPVCGPSRASILTGLSPWDMFIRGNAGNRRDHTLSATDGSVLFTAIKAQGYNVGYAGKWGFCDDPIQAGVDIFYGLSGHFESHSFYPPRAYYYRAPEGTFAQPMFPSESDPPFDPEYGANVLLPKNANTRNTNRCSATRGRQASPTCSHIEVESADKALMMMDEFIADYAASDGERPFFLFYSSFVPHLGTASEDPDAVDEKAIDHYDEECLDLPVLAGMPSLQKTSECKHKSMLENYVDQLIGDILARLAGNDIDDRTLFIMTSDHGSEQQQFPRSRTYIHEADTFPSTGGLRGIKRELYEGGTRLPTLMRWPGIIPPGSVIPDLMSTYDFFPTILDVARSISPEDADLSDEQDRDAFQEMLANDYNLRGLSFLPVMMGESKQHLQQQHEFIEFVLCDPYDQILVNLNQAFSEAGHNDVTQFTRARLLEMEQDNCSWAVRKGRHKLYFNHKTAEYRLFDLEANPTEADNQALPLTGEVFDDLNALYDGQYKPTVVFHEQELVCTKLYGFSSDAPTGAPSTSPTSKPSESPTTTPTKSPSTSPTSSPTKNPTESPTTSPTLRPTVSPTQAPTVPAPTSSPTTSTPSVSPTTSEPTLPEPTQSPTTPEPTQAPTQSPFVNTTAAPTGARKPDLVITIAPALDEDSSGAQRQLVFASSWVVVASIVGVTLAG